MFGGQFAVRQSPDQAYLEWYKDNVSVYGATERAEEIAELIAYVTREDYVRGTLPQPLEEFVDFVFSAANRPQTPSSKTGYKR
jgi:hypothetical protein